MGLGFRVALNPKYVLPQQLVSMSSPAYCPEKVSTGGVAQDVQ